MSNLGDSNTPVEGESFGLPAGAELGEDNGDLVIQDSSGSIILRRDETNAEWQFENTDLTGINSVDASSATLDDATVANSPTNNDDVVRKTETDAIQNDVDGKVEQTEFDNHSTQHENGGTDALDLTGLSGDLADQQQPTDHVHDGTADSGGGSLNPEATTLQDTQQPTTDGEIRRSGSDVYIHTNGLSRNTSDFLTASQVEILWTEDGNSPKTVTNTKDITYTLAGEYDIVHISAKMYGGRPDWAIQANGGTGTDYVYVEPSGNQVVGDTYIPVGNINDSSGGTGVAFGAVVSGRWSTYMYFGPLSPQYGSATQGSFAGTSGPLTQFRLFGSGSGLVPDEVVIEVRGRDIA